MKITIVDLRYSVGATNENLKIAKSDVIFRLSSSLGVQSLHDNKSNLVSLGTVSETYKFLKGFNYALSLMGNPSVVKTKEFREDEVSFGDRGK